MSENTKAGKYGITYRKLGVFHLWLNFRYAAMVIGYKHRFRSQADWANIPTAPLMWVSHLTSLLQFHYH